MEFNQTQQVTSALVEAYGIAAEKRHEFLTPEHLLAGFLKDKDFWECLAGCGRAEELEENLYGYLNSLECLPEDIEPSIHFSSQMNEVYETAGKTVAAASASMIHVHHMMYSYFQLEDSNARYFLERCLDCPIPDFLNSLIEMGMNVETGTENDMDRNGRYFRELEPFHTLTGRKTELDRMVRILSRKTRNNVLVAGGHGVGKTALVKGLSAMIEDGKVPEKLQDSRIIELNVSSLLSGAQFRGDLEGRIQQIMESAEDEGNLIVYVDELRSLGGSSRNDDSSKDILSLLTPYFKSSKIKFIISANYEDIKKVSTSDGSILGLFRQIDLEEPSAEETYKILDGLRPELEEHHGVHYEEEAVRHAIDMSIRYISDRCLPDKAIDLMDEAGAYAYTHKSALVSPGTVDLALADICRTDVQASDEEIRSDLYNMEERLSETIYGQEKAIKTVSEAVLMSKAGLLDSGRTIGNFLFVGPTGVGKTELAKALARQLHVPLHRFDMSEYTEKHSVAKLIGSPAGYVGYDDGGILTDTIRKNPYCILLLDEIEKAHEDIYNLLLQVMDYAVITDNKGRKIDFRNVVLIMTSNVGARYAHKSAIGFESKVNAGEAMAKEVKNVFAPEFINRLSSVVIFNDLDGKMAERILNNKIELLQKRLKSKNIDLVINSDAFTRLLKEGYSREYGAREIERVLNARLTPLLMREILFGAKENFTAEVYLSDDEFKIRTR